jgi:hypothetical protein
MLTSYWQLCSCSCHVLIDELSSVNVSCMLLGQFPGTMCTRLQNIRQGSLYLVLGSLYLVLCDVSGSSYISLDSVLGHGQSPQLLSYTMYLWRISLGMF